MEKEGGEEWLEGGQDCMFEYDINFIRVNLNHTWNWFEFIIDSDFQHMQASPFKFGEITNISNLGIDPQFFKFGVTNLES